MSGIHAPSRPAALAPGAGYDFGLGARQFATSASPGSATLASEQALLGLDGIGGEAPPAASGCGCSCAQAKAGGGALGGVDAAPAPDAPKPVKVEAPKQGGGGGGGGGGGAVQELRTDGPQRLAGESSHGGLQPKALAILGAAQAAGLKLISGLRAGDDGGHGNGTAVDVANVPGGSRQGSPEMAAFAESVRAAGKAGDPNVGYVIYQQKIASARDNWAWRPMEDRGSNTQNHFDHVHVSTDPNR